jgi:ABC-2 type transport system ATP-binding protein
MAESSPATLATAATATATTSLGDEALSCRGLTKRFADVQAVNGVDLSVRRGECFGLLGPNGAGKTTTIEILEGLTPHDGGTVTVLGGAPGSDEARRKIGLALQETHFIDKLTVEETVRLFRSFYRQGRTVDDVLRRLELEEKRAGHVGKLSGGQRQRLALACALVGDPDLIFLDEPTTGLDPQARLKVWEIVQAFRAEGGTVVLTTHYMEEAARLCDRIAIMDHGRVVAVGTPKELIASLGAPLVIDVLTSPALTIDQIGDLPGVVKVEARAEAVSLYVDDIARALPRVLEAVSQPGVALKQIVTREATLEDVFVHLTGARLRDG